MKTTIEIADDVLTRAKRQARQEGKTLREVVERALRQQLAAPDVHGTFRLKRRPFKGRGRHPGVTEGDWQSIRDLIYRIG
ncbi:MAG: type II toxin-antitoxin system VapB family antitoxin [Vicinamibacterales bacterium]